MRNYTFLKKTRQSVFFISLAPLQLFSIILVSKHLILIKVTEDPKSLPQKILEGPRIHSTLAVRTMSSHVMMPLENSTVCCERIESENGKQASQYYKNSLASQTHKRILGTPGVPRPHFENHCSVLLLQRIHSIAAFCFCFFPPHHVIDLINRYLGTGKKIVVFRGQFILPADFYLRVKGFSQYPSPQYRDRMILEPTYKTSG